MATKLQPGFIFTKRDAPPTHYIFKIQSFSFLSKASLDGYDSDTFEAGGYKWKLSVHPNGNKIRNEKDHISLYLVMEATSSLSLGWEVNVIYSLFVYNKFEDKYLSFQDERVRRFHALKTEWGLTKLMDLSTFNDPSSGYLSNDTCVFGAEVFVIKSAGKGEWLSVIEGAVPIKQTFKIPQSHLDSVSSVPFNAGGYEWKINIYFRGKGDGKNNSISLFLSLTESIPPPYDTKVHVKYSLGMLPHCFCDPFEKQGSHLFSAPNQESGFPKFMPFGELIDPKKGYLQGGNYYIEAQVTILGLVTKLS